MGGKVDPNLQPFVSAPEETDESISSKITAYLKNVKLPGIIDFENGVYKVADNSFDAMQGTIARMKLAAYPPDVEIEIPRNLCGTLEFNRADEIIAYGYDLCEKLSKEGIL